MTIPKSSPTDGQPIAQPGKYLTFTLGTEEFGIGILKVKEIIGIMPITAIPKTPNYIRGIINLRGKVIPIIDLRLKFGMPIIPATEKNCIIVVEINATHQNAPLQMGIVVDSVSEVLNIQKTQIDKAPQFGVSVDTHFILGIAKMEDRVKILLDIDTVLSSEDIVQLEHAAV